jgi:DNA-binding NarL/FixJ family response regulator
MEMPDTPIRVLIADDQGIILDGLEALLAQMPDIALVGRAHGGREAIDLARREKPDVVVMDVSMPGMDGIEATRTITGHLPGCGVLMLSMYDQAALVAEAMAAGARGYLLKNTGKNDLHTAIRTVAAGGTYKDKGLPPPQYNGSWSPDPHLSITRREKEVLALLAKGLNNSAIAATLNLSVSTIETHRKNLMEKLDIHTAAGLVKYAMERGWVL